MSSSIALISKSLSFLVEQDVGPFFLYRQSPCSSMRCVTVSWTNFDYEWNYEWKVINIL